jgi:hypothetical protein
MAARPIHQESTVIRQVIGHHDFHDARDITAHHRDLPSGFMPTDESGKIRRGHPEGFSAELIDQE